VIRTTEELAKAKAGRRGRAGKTGSAAAAETASRTRRRRRMRRFKGVFVMVGRRGPVPQGADRESASDTDLEVSGDLKPKDKVIIGPNKVLRQLKPGSRVKVEEPKTKKGEKR